jgi:hypothetical protein
MIDYAKILEHNFQGSQWYMSSDTYESLEWLSETTKPTKAQLDGLWSVTQIKMANNVAKQNRENAYKFESDGLFFKAQRGEATIEEWQAKVAEIKARFPYQE